MTFISRDKIEELLQNAPEGVGAESIISELRNRGHTLEGFEPKPQRGGFLQRVKEDIGRRTEKLFKGTTEISEKGKQQTLPETTLQLFGQVAGGILDVGQEALVSGFRGIGRIFENTPDFIEDFVKEEFKKAGSTFIESPIGQSALNELKKGIDAWEGFKEEHPRAARNVEAVVNIAALFPIGKAAEPVGKAGGVVLRKGAGIAAKTAGRGAGALEVSGRVAIASERQGFIRQLIRPVQTKAVKEAQVTRTLEKGRGPFKRSIIKPSQQELRSEIEVLKIPEVSSKKTLQGNFNAIAETNRAEAIALENALKNNDFIFTKKELLKKLRDARNNLKKNPAITGDAEKTADKLIVEIERRINEASNKGSELLKVRKEFDQWVRNQKGASAFDPAKDNAFTIANREIRQTINDFLDVNAPSAGVRDSLRKQSSLFNALDNLAPKAAIEADTAFRRFLQRASEVLGTKNKVVQALAAAVGIGGLGAAATFAPAAATLGVGGFLIFQAGKLVLKPEVRLLTAKLLRELERILEKASGATSKGLLDEITKIGDNLLQE